VDWNKNGGQNLAERYGMDNSSIALRRQFVRLGEEERKLLAEMAPWAKSVAAQIARDFYDWQFNFGPTREFFENFAREKGMPLAAMRTHLARIIREDRSEGVSGDMASPRRLLSA
jgi:hypothetical protein